MVTRGMGALYTRTSKGDVLRVPPDAATRQSLRDRWLDVPFAGALVPLEAYHKDRRMWSVMIEVNRGIYMNEHSGLANQEFRRVRAVIGQLIVTAAEAVMSDPSSG